MLIVGFVGSPRKDGRTSALIDAALEGAASAGADVQKLYLVDYDIRAFTGAGGPDDRYCPEVLSALCEKAGAIVVGAPVYYGEINGLTKDWMDSVRIRNSNGKPALGFAIAGGSGKGLLSGVQSIYHWFYHRQVRAIDPTPVSRFNMQAAQESLKKSGTRLVEMAQDVHPFSGERRDDRWADVLAYYATLPYFDCDPLDEFLMLARQLIALSNGDEVEQAQAELDQALILIENGQRSEGARHAVRAYEILYFAG
ncbi:MAG: NAD(P)H-dependent oxidoreductase [Anaerolineae bacterium]|nr:NAD(P)H-dependent oxidoreductase [Anaerolineae bacterium]